MPEQIIKIFISYRRDDSQYVTDNIHDHLIRHFGEENVFLDVQNIPFGVDFRQYLAEQVAGNDVVLCIIGPDWARILRERASQQNDFVRIEIESALDQRKLLIPVIVMNARMPDFSDLPASIAPLQWLQSATIRRKPDLEGDCARLAEGIRRNFRKPTSIEFLPQPFDWIDIPAGQVTFEDGYGTFDVPAFTIAKYPVTVAQYEVFMNDGGYEIDRWWTKSGWQWLQEQGYRTPRYWDDKEWKSLWKPDHPVVGISWFEAYAFTQWLSDKMGENIHLPTEQQWQHAAQGDDDRTYPWGNKWDSSRCNNDVDGRDWQKRRNQGNITSPVTQYEGKGNSPFEVVDMAGNVWEWTNSVYETEQLVDIEDTNIQRVVRGGSWYLPDTGFFRIALRLNWSLDVRDYDLGFRVARSLK